MKKYPNIFGALAYKNPVELLFIILFAMIPSLLVLFWCITNTQLPIADGSDYIGSAGHLYGVYQHHGFFKWLTSLYTDRGWRPVSFPVLMMPFMIMSKGNLFFSYSALSSISMLAGTLYVFLLLNIRLGRISSILGACLISCLPLVLTLGLKFFFCEVALYPCLFALIYHLIKSDYLRIYSHSFAMSVALALAMTLRPIEAVLHVAFPLALFCYLGWKNNKFSFREIHISLSIILIGLFVLLLNGIHIEMDTVNVINNDTVMAQLYVKFFKVSACLILIVLGFLYRSVILNTIKKFFTMTSRQNTHHFLIPVIFLSTFLAVIWWLPYIQRLTEWTYMTSIGGLAKGLPYAAATNVLFDIINECSLLTLALISSMFLIGVLFASKQKMNEILSSPAFYYPLSVFPVPFLVTLFTVQTTSRKIAIAIPFLIVALMQFALMHGKWSRARNGILALLLAVQVFSVSWLFIKYHQGQSITNQELIYLTGAGNLPVPVIYRPNPHDLTLAFLKENAKKYDIHHIALQISSELKVTVDPFLLLTMVGANNLSFTTSYPYYDHFSREIEKAIYNRFDALLLINPFGKMEISSDLAKRFAGMYDISTPWEKITFDTLYLFASGKMNELGWVKGPCYTFKTDKEYEGCLFLKQKSQV